MRYVLYARKSTESEDRQVQSLGDQLSIMRRLAAERGLSVAEEVIESKSAKAPGSRPGFARVVDTVEAGKADGILCWSLNRLSRNPVDSGRLSWLLQTGVLRSIVTPEREYRPEDNVLVFSVETGMANQYILDLRRAVARGTRSKVEKGWYPHRAPEGYRNDVATRTIEADGERFTLLREAWDMLLTGAHTVPQVRDELTRRGFRTKRTRRSGGSVISRSALYRVFQNPFYKGEFVHQGERVRGAHPPMVSAEEFARAQRLLGREGRPSPRKVEWAFVGLIRCGLCGHLVTAERKVKHYKRSGAVREYSYYHCAGRSCRPKVSVSELMIDEAVEAMLEGCRLTPEVADWCLKAWDRWEAERGAADGAAALEAERALVEARRRMERLYTMREDEELTREEFAARKSRLENEVAGLEEAVRGDADRARRERESVAGLVRFCETAYGRFTRGDARAKREVAYALGGGLALTLGELEILPHPLLDAVRVIEPPERGFGSQKKGTLALTNPTWWAMRDRIRTCLDAAEHDEGSPFSGFHAPCSSNL